MSTKEMNMSTNDMNLIGTGIIVTKNEYESEKGIKYSLDVAIPNCKEFLNVSVTEERWKKVVIGQVEIFKLSFQIWKNRLYFKEL